MNNKFDLVCQLGSQVMYADGQYELAPHTLMRTMASAIILKMGITPRLIVLGGSNFGVRYDDNKIFDDQHPTEKGPTFTFEAFASSDYDRKSEATIIKERLVDWLGVSFVKKILAETLSSTTEENAEFLKIIMKRQPMFTGNEKIGILTFLHHMERALPLFKKVGLNVEPVLVEDILVMDAKARQNQQNIELGYFPIDAYGVHEVCRYYFTPRSGKWYNTARIYQLLSEGKSLAEMMN